MRGTRTTRTTGRRRTRKGSSRGAEGAGRTPVRARSGRSFTEVTLRRPTRRDWPSGRSRSTMGKTQSGTRGTSRSCRAKLGHEITRGRLTSTKKCPSVPSMDSSRSGVVACDYDPKDGEDGEENVAVLEEQRWLRSRLPTLGYGMRPCSTCPAAPTPFTKRSSTFCQTLTQEAILHPTRQHCSDHHNHPPAARMTAAHELDEFDDMDDLSESMKEYG